MYLTTPLNGSISSSATTLILTSGAGFSTSDVVVIGTEQILLGTKSGNTFTGCSRGWNGTTIVSHTSGDSVLISGNTLTIEGHDVNFMDFRVTDSDPTRVDVRNDANHFYRFSGVWHDGPRTNLINMVIDNHGTGVFSTINSVDSTFYGSLFYNNGFVLATGQPHGHGWYIQNNTGTKTFAENLTFNNFVFGGQEESDHGNTINMANRGIVVFNNPFLLGTTSATADNCSLDSSYFFENGITGLRAGYQGTDNRAIAITNNYFGGVSSNVVQVTLWKSVTFTGNTMTVSGANDSTRAVYLDRTLGGTFTWNRNTYYDQSNTQNCAGGSFRGPFNYSGSTGACGGTLKYAEWQTASGLDATGSTYSQSIAPDLVVVRPNSYQAGRANVIIYNWSHASSVSVNLSTAGLTNGQAFEIRNAQNYFRTTLYSGTYNSSSPTVSLSMTSAAATTVEQPIGYNLGRPTTLPTFGALVVVPR